MKKFAITAAAALVAVTSLASVAEARHRHFDDFDGFDDDFRPRCSKIVIIKKTDFGKVVKIIKKCR